MKTKSTNDHHTHGLLTLERERTILHDNELELTCGPNGVTAELVADDLNLDTPREPIGVRVSLHPFLAGMNHHHLMLLIDCATVLHFKKGAILLKEGEHADRFYLLETGKVLLEAITDEHQHVVVETISAGELLGWSWIFPPYVWHFNARAVEPTDAIVFSGPALREYCERVHSLGYELFKRMTAVMMRRMQTARLKMLEAQSSSPRRSQCVARHMHSKS